MKYKRKPEIIDAWQYQPDKPMPVWVARHVHHIGDEFPNDRTCKDWQGVLHTVEPGDYIISNQGSSGVLAPVPARLFEAHYEPAE